MPLRVPLLLVLFTSARVLPALAQTQAKDPVAVSLLTASLTAAGGTAGVSTLQDFSATGTVTYYWAGQPVTGTATVLGRGSDQFRLNATLSTGSQAYAINNGTGQFQDTTGAITTIPYHNTVNVGVLSFPYLTIAEQLNDSAVAISFLGLVSDSSGAQLNEIQAQRTAFRVLTILRANRRDPWCHRMLGRLRLPASVHDQAEYRVWQKRFYPFNVYCEKNRLEKLDSMHDDPVSRRHVASPDEWLWSSWRFYYFGDDSVIRMDRLA